jgi:alkaline phosphatase
MSLGALRLAAAACALALATACPASREAPASAAGEAKPAAAAAEAAADEARGEAERGPSGRAGETHARPQARGEAEREPVGPANEGPEHWRALGREALARARSLAPAGRPARSAILFVGDGMSLATVAAARILEGQRRGGRGEEHLLSFERFPHVALVKTYNTDQQVPDSAGTMSAIVTGVKTRSGVISMDARVTPGKYTPDFDAHVVPTLLEQAEDRGLSTGVVTNTTLTHATPAACYAHAPDRSWQHDSRLPAAALHAGFPDIARQLVEFRRGDGLEVALGGGRSFFLPEEVVDPEDPEATGDREDERDLVQEWQRRRPRSAYVWNAEQLRAIDPARTDHLLGLFDPQNMRFEFERAKDRAGEPSLSEMTAKAIEILARNPKGFFLMVEGGRIDHAHHYGNAYRALTETIEFSNAVRAALERTDPDQTLVVVTSDHGHTLTIGGHPTRGNPILGKVVENDDHGAPLHELAEDGTGVPYTTLSYANGPGYAGAHAEQPEGPKRFSEESASGQRGITRGPPDLTGVDTEAPDYLQTAAVPLPSETHSGEDVPVYATGPGAQLFHGVQEQSYLYYAIAEALGWKPDSR